MPKELSAEALRDGLLRAVYENQAQAVVQLLERRASLTTTDGLGQSPLHWAARQGHEAAARVLLGRGASPNVQSDDGASPLYLAAAASSASVVALLLSFSADLLLADRQGRTPLHIAAENGSEAAVAALLKAPKAELQLAARNRNGDAPLGSAAARGRAEVLQLLLTARAGLGHRNRWQQGALHVAVKGGHAAAVAVLLAAGASPMVPAGDGVLPLHDAADRGDPALLKLLLEHGAEVNATGPSGRSALHIIAERGKVEVMEVILGQGANLEARTADGQTPLVRAAARGHTAVVERLLNSRAEIEACDSVHRTALHLASCWGHTDVVELLLKARANLSAVDMEGHTPLWFALDRQKDGAIRLLLRAGAVGPPHLLATNAVAAAALAERAQLFEQERRRYEAGSSLQGGTDQKDLSVKLGLEQEQEEAREQNSDCYSDDGFCNEEKDEEEERSEGEKASPGTEEEQQQERETKRKEDAPEQERQKEKEEERSPKAMPKNAEVADEQKENEEERSFEKKTEGTEEGEEEEYDDEAWEKEEEDELPGPRGLLMSSVPQVEKATPSISVVRAPSAAAASVPARPGEPSTLLLPRALSPRPSSSSSQGGSRSGTAASGSCAGRLSGPSWDLQAAAQSAAALKAGPKEVRVFLQLLRDGGGGNLIVGWRRLLDPEGRGAVSFSKLCDVLGKLKYQEDVAELWHRLVHSEKERLRLDHVDPVGATQLALVGRWCAQRCGSFLGLMERADSGRGTSTNNSVLDALRRLGLFPEPGQEPAVPGLVSELEARSVILAAVDPEGRNCILPQDFLILEPDLRLRRRLLRRLELAATKGQTYRDVLAECLHESAESDISAPPSRMNSARSRRSGLEEAEEASRRSLNHASEMLFLLAKRSNNRHWKQADVDILEPMAEGAESSPADLRPRGPEMQGPNPAMMPGPSRAPPGSRRKQKPPFPPLLGPSPSAPALLSRGAVEEPRASRQPQARGTGSRPASVSRHASLPELHSVQPAVVLEAGDDGRPQQRKKLKRVYGQRQEGYLPSIPPGRQSAMAVAWHAPSRQSRDSEHSKRERRGLRQDRTRAAPRPEDFLRPQACAQLFDRYYSEY